MRVANIIEEARVGGPQIRNLIVSSVLKKYVDVTLIFPKENSRNLEKRCVFFGVKYLQLSLTTIKKSLFSIILYILLFPFEVIILAWMLKKNNFDLVHVSGGSWQTKGICAAKLARIKVVWELNDTYTPFIIRVIFFFLSHLANGFIFASKKTKRYYFKLIPSNRKSFIIQSPVDTNFFNPDLKYPNIKFFKKKIAIGTVANLSPVKNVEMFLKAAKELSSYSNKIMFFIIGSIHLSQKKYYQDLKDTIKQLKIKNFFFLKLKKDIRPLLKTMDIYVCTSKNESSPLSVWEAMSMKKPIVSTDVGDVSKYIKHDVNGYIVKANNTIDLAKSIKKLIEEPKLRKKFGKRSRQIAKKNFNLKVCRNLHLNAYKMIFNNFSN